MDRRATKIVVLAVLAFMLLFATFDQDFQLQSVRSLRDERVLKARNECLPAKRILMWTTFWQEQSFGWERMFYRLVSKQCGESRCELMYDHRLLSSADAVVFHAIDLHPDYILPEYHSPNQVWIFFSAEAPPSVVEDKKVDLSRLGGVFNWTMTYRRDSDVVIPYGRIIPKQSAKESLPAKNYWIEKNVNITAAWMVSHCGTVSRREWFVKELVKFMKVDVFGRCGHKKCGKNISFKTLGTFNMDICNEEIEKYMFYFAFENAICQDYVTEKFFLALKLDVVPVVFGGGNYEAIAPPNSFINALNFPSPKSLAEYLKMVAKNATMYNKYFEWKGHYEVELGHPFSPMICDLCSKLHSEESLNRPSAKKSGAEEAGVVLSVHGRDHTGAYPDIDSWFDKGSSCRRWWAGPYDRRSHWKN